MELLELWQKFNFHNDVKTTPPLPARKKKTKENKTRKIEKNCLPPTPQPTITPRPLIPTIRFGRA